MQTSRAPRRVTSGARPARPAWRRWRPAGLAWALWALAMLSVPMAAWLDHLLRQAGRPDLLELTPTAIPPVLGAVSAATVGAVLATRRPRHPAGWLLLALGLSLSASGPAEAYTNYAVASPGAPPAASLVALYMPATVVTAFACIGFVLLLTPTGTLPSPRWRWWARAMVATPVALLLVVTLAPRPGDQPSQTVDNPLDLHALSGVLLIANQTAFAVTIIAFVVAAASLVVRFRRARGTERQQLRWVALATVVVSLLFVVVLAALALETFALAALAGSLCVAVLPLAIGAAVLRYRLYDLDRIISRTLSYGLLTVLLGGAYAGVVLGFGELLGRASSLAGRRSDPGGGGGVPARPPPHPAAGRPALQPSPLRRHPDDHAVQRPAAPGDRPGRPDHRASGRRRPDHAADSGVPVAAAIATARISQRSLDRGRRLSATTNLRNAAR